jgi:hypothetical protein
MRIWAPILSKLLRRRVALRPGPFGACRPRRPESLYQQVRYRREVGPDLMAGSEEKTEGRRLRAAAHAGTEFMNSPLDNL